MMNEILQPEMIMRHDMIDMNWTGTWIDENNKSLNKLQVIRRIRNCSEEWWLGYNMTRNKLTI